MSRLYLVPNPRDEDAEIDAMAARDAEPAHAATGYTPPPSSPVDRCRKCGEKPEGGILHGMGDEIRRVYCGRCVGDFNARRSGRAR